MSADLAVGVDVATGAYNRARFERELSAAVSDAKRNKAAISLLYVDADDFLEHQDVNGRERTEELLSWLADRVAEVTNGRGPVGRIDEDAFAVFLPAFTLAEACKLAEQIRLKVGTSRHTGSAGPFRVTISVGVAALRRNEPWGNLMEAAETACRRAKQGGRDRTARR